jgi:hypothetical protein
MCYTYDMDRNDIISDIVDGLQFATDSTLVEIYNRVDLETCHEKVRFDGEDFIGSADAEWAT